MKTFALILALLPLAASATTITVSSTADNLTAGNGQCTLRETIANVNAAADTTGGDCAAGTGGGDTINFGFAMPAKIRLALGQLMVQRDVSIENPAPAMLGIDGGGTSRVFEIAAGRTSMSGVKIQRGRADNGGGIMVDQGATLSLIDCDVTANTATYGGDHNIEKTAGGGIYNAGTLDLTRCRLKANRVITGEDALGGAIFNAGGVVTLSDALLDGNRCTSIDSTFDSGGAGIRNQGGTAIITNSRLRRNVVLIGYGISRGAGISNVKGALTVRGCSFENNRAALAPGAYNDSSSGFVNSYGGGLYSDTDDIVTVTDSTFFRNAAVAGSDSTSDGGAIFNEYKAANMMVSNCAFLRNRSVLSGFGASFGGAIENAGTMNLSGCTFSRNAALLHGNGSSHGGAVYNYDQASMTVVNCTFNGNRAAACTSSALCESSGGGIASDGPLQVTNSTLIGNTTRQLIDGEGAYPTGGGIAGGSWVTLTNTIVASSGHAANCDTVQTSGGHNLSSDDTCFTSGGTDLLNTKPQLAPLAHYGGPTQTMALCTAAGVPRGCRGASPAIDAGDDTVTGPPNNLTTDQRGLPRLSGAHVDIGACEAQ